ncbi:SpoIIE family protein phosphatase [Clostridium magnum]|uniref:Stage II sporulation protein SpoIIE n=1 Tax=Clostridium magnum DSM 2767 TaxID=1121326 RepID=A0A162TDU4_9CLOT|nr:SpoIIE family protein phosphatase [Clostridium magnum]KZL92520.1 stage II sporulation protein SpoIIE [Clostridium magnum DSM 2767]SHI79636.1 Serine phosphatase RsbU, regulator of sigma subunit [Clostridium magnum DSM 2767]
MHKKFSISKRKKSKELNPLLDNNSIKVIIAGCVAIAIAMIIMSITSMIITRNAVIHKLKSTDIYNLARSISGVIDGKIEKSLETSLTLADDPTIIKWIESSDEDKQSERIVQSKMGNIVNDLGYDTSFLVSNKTNNYWSYHNKKFELLDVVSKEDPNDKWYFNTINMKKRYAINIDSNSELHNTFLWINTLVGDIYNPIAVTGIGMDLGSVIGELIAEESKNEVKNDIWLVNESNIISLSKNSEYINKNLSDYIPDSLASTIGKHGNLDDKEFEVSEYKNTKGEIYDLAFKGIKGCGWKIIVRIPRTESLSVMNAITVNTVMSCFLIILIMVIIFYLISKKIADPYKRALILNQELEKKVEERTKELQEKNAKIQDSIEYAKMIQDTILPSHSEMNITLKDYFIISKPRDIVGGDFYWMKTYKDHFLLLVGDCTGHGVPGALMTTAVTAMLNHIVDEINNDNPSIILQELDRLIKQSFRADSTNENIEYGLDAGILYVSKEKEILFSGAKISAIIVDENGVKEIKPGRKTINCKKSNKEIPFKNYEIKYNPGATIYMATDGITDQVGGEKRLPYGKKKLMASIEEVKNFKMKEQADIIIHSFENYYGNEMLRDDITILGFKL